jgi:hypothetical protein
MHLVVNLTDVELLLDRLDPRLDEPCAVPGCCHLHGPAGVHGATEALRAA